MTTMWDVAVVGGGPAGSSTALHLVRAAGIRPDRILILDKARFPREKPCAGAISQAGVDALRAIGVTLEVPQVAMRGIRILDGGAVGASRVPLGVVVRRDEHDAFLLETARRDGVVVKDGEGLVSLERVAGGFRLVTSAGVHEARYVAACDGAGSPTRKLLGIREPERKGHLYVLETEPGASDAGPREGLVDFDLSVLADGLEGYYWDFPTVLGGRAAVSRGIYHANFTPSSRVKEALGRALAARGVDIASVKLKPFATRPFVPETITWRDRLVLVGEAAGIDQATGEGIAQALEMGGIAAHHLARALRTGGTSFEGYDRAVRTSTMGRHMLQSAWLARRVYRARIGAPARRYLVTSHYARTMGVSWYRGETLPLRTIARLGVGLLRASL